MAGTSIGSIQRGATGACSVRDVRKEFVDPHKARPKKGLVWRISEKAPMGEWVDTSAPPPPPPPAPPAPKKDLPEVYSGGWVVSSFDLLAGVDISESPDTVPDELFDELFRRTDTPPKTPEK